MAYPQGTASPDMTSGIFASDFSPDIVTGGIVDNHTPVTHLGMRNSHGYQLSLLQNFVNEEFLGRYDNSINSGFINNIRAQSSGTLYLGDDEQASTRFSYVSINQNAIEIREIQPTASSGLLINQEGIHTFSSGTTPSESLNSFLHPDMLHFSATKTGVMSEVHMRLDPAEDYKAFTIESTDRINIRPNMNGDGDFEVNVFGDVILPSGDLIKVEDRDGLGHIATMGDRFFTLENPTITKGVVINQDAITFYDDCTISASPIRLSSTRELDLVANEGLDPGYVNLSGDFIALNAADYILAYNLTQSDPGVSGALWRDGLDLKVSMG